jgi:hypothetical protein
MPELPDPARIESKGFTLQGALAYVEERHGEAGRARVLAALDDEARTVLSGHVLASSWYPFRVQVAIYEAVDRLWGTGDFALCWQIGRFTAEYEATTIHKLFLKLARLDTWLKVAGTMWSRYYSAGRLEPGEFTDGGGELRVRDFNPISRAFCHDLGGWFWRTAEMSGKKGVEVRHERCLLAGDDACLYHASWR